MFLVVLPLVNMTSVFKEYGIKKAGSKLKETHEATAMNLW